ncbi:MAG: hypothetical protein V2A54_04280 [Bacteroidota bacterium]
MKKHHFFHQYFLILTAALFSGCTNDTNNYHYYNIRNSYNKDIIIKYSIATADIIKDTILVSEEKNLYIWDYCADEVEDNAGWIDKDQHDSFGTISLFEVITIDSIVSIKNFKKRIEWNYTKDNRHKATYLLIIDSSDF